MYYTIASILVLAVAAVSASAVAPNQANKVLSTKSNPNAVHTRDDMSPRHQKCDCVDQAGRIDRQMTDICCRAAIMLPKVGLAF